MGYAGAPIRLAGRIERRASGDGVGPAGIDAGVAVNVGDTQKPTDPAQKPANSATGSNGPVVVVKSVNVVYGGVIEVLDGVSLEVGNGQVVAILGANGAGKTTLLRAISGLLAFQNGAITAGSVELFGADVTKTDAASRVRSGMAQVMEGRRIFSELTVDENLKVGAYTRKEKSEITVSYDRVMTLFPRLAERRKQIAGYMSGGEQQMVAMGRALMANPRLLLLDEPSLGLAPLIVEQIRDIVVEINKQGTSVLIVEQNASMALSISDYGYVMETGTVAKEGPGSVLLNDPEIKALYLGGESEHTSFHDLKSYRNAREYVG